MSSLVARHAERFEGRVPRVESVGWRLHLIAEYLGPEGRQPSGIGAVERDLHFFGHGSTLAGITDRWVRQGRRLCWCRWVQGRVDRRAPRPGRQRARRADP